jgi:hypothetical protein
METDLKAVQQELTRRDPRWAEWVDALVGAAPDALAKRRGVPVFVPVYAREQHPAHYGHDRAAMRAVRRAPIHRDGDTARITPSQPSSDWRKRTRRPCAQLGFGYRAKTLIAAARALHRARRRLAEWLANAGLLGRQDRN